MRIDLSQENNRKELLEKLPWSHTRYFVSWLFGMEDSYKEKGGKIKTCLNSGQTSDRFGFLNNLLSRSHSADGLKIANRWWGHL